MEREPRKLHPADKPADPNRVRTTKAEAPTERPRVDQRAPATPANPEGFQEGAVTEQQVKSAERGV